MAGKVTIIGNGRDGRVRYQEGANTIDGYWEFGGNEVVTIVSMGEREEWRGRHPWALDRRADILRFVADEVIRLRAPTCTATIDEESGTILVRAPGGGTYTAPRAEAKAAAFVKRYSTIKAMVGIGVLLLLLVAGAVLWVGKKVLTVAPANGVPLNECVRTDRHIASLIQYTDPHLPNITGRGGNETTSISILLIPLDGAEPRVVPVVSKLDGVHYGLARIMGSDGQTLWLDCTGLFGVRLSDYKLVTSKDLQQANPAIDPQWWDDTRGMAVIDGKLHIMNDDRSAALDVEPSAWKATSVEPKPSKLRFDRQEPTDQLAAGLITSAGTWLGLLSPGELDGEFKVKSWIKRVEAADDAKQLRRFCSAHLEASSEGDHFRILDMAAIGTKEYLNAAFLRMDANAEPLRLKDPESVLMIHTDAPGLGGKLVVSRTDMQGNLLWSTETGLDRYYVSQILPGAEAFAFVGTRPPVEGKLSEPLMVLIDNATGQTAVHSLWR